MKIDIRHIALTNVRPGAWPEAIAHMLERKDLRDPNWALYDFTSRERAKLVQDPVQILTPFQFMEREFSVGFPRKISTVILPAERDISEELALAIVQARACRMQVVMIAPDQDTFDALPALVRAYLPVHFDCEALRAELDPPAPTPREIGKAPGVFRRRRLWPARRAKKHDEIG